MPITSEKTFLELVASYHKNPSKYIFFAGAGLSQPLFPSWANLLKTFVEQAKENYLQHDENEIRNYIDNGENYLDIAEVCISAMGASRYRDIMEKTFDKDFSEKDVPDAYKALMALAPKAIITTNYDRIPDIAGKGCYRINTNKTASEASRLVSDNKNFVFKIHGDITDQSSIVLTTSEYQEIMNNNQSTRLLLNSLLSTKVLIFVGFSLSDPHIGMILENIKSINNGLPISHYLLLNESSSFKISSFENKYGVKVISYTPSNSSHPEVVDFLRALNHEAGTSPENVEFESVVKIENKTDLISHVNNAIEEIIFDTGISIFYSKDELHISFTPTGETKGEIQKELLSIINVFGFKCSFLKKILISAIVSHHTTSISPDEIQYIFLKAELNFDEAHKYAAKEITTSTLWKLIKFYRPASLTNCFISEERGNFPMSTGIVGEQL